MRAGTASSPYPRSAPRSPSASSRRVSGVELSGLVELLAADAAFHGDGGGKAVAFTRPVVGADRVSRLLAGVFAKLAGAGARMERVEVNGQPGAKWLDRRGRVFTVWALDIADGRVQCIRSVVNPEKLRHLGPVSEALVRPLYTRER